MKVELRVEIDDAAPLDFLLRFPLLRIGSKVFKLLPVFLQAAKIDEQILDVLQKACERELAAEHICEELHTCDILRGYAYLAQV